MVAVHGAGDPAGAGEAISAHGPSDLPEWLTAYADAKQPRVKSSEMIEALDAQWAREGMSARAVAAINGGEFSKEHLRRIAALEAARDTMERLAQVFDDLSPKIRKAILGLEK